MTKNIIQKINLKLIVALVVTSLIISGMHIADAVPSGAKQFGSKTAIKMKTAEINQDIIKTAEKKTTFPKNHNGIKSEVKNEIIKIEKKLAEEQKAMEKFFKLYYKTPYKGQPIR